MRSTPRHLVGIACLPLLLAAGTTRPVRGTPMIRVLDSVPHELMPANGHWTKPQAQKVADAISTQLRDLDFTGIADRSKYHGKGKLARFDLLPTPLNGLKINVTVEGMLDAASDGAFSKDENRERWRVSGKVRKVHADVGPRQIDYTLSVDSIELSDAPVVHPATKPAS